jgi:hypothetical protein
MSTLTRILTRRSRLIPALAAVVSAIAIVPAVASASTATFGSSLNHDPANAGSTCADNGIGSSTLCTHVGSFYPGFSGHAQSPVNGTITGLKLRPQGPMTFTAKVLTVRRVSSDHRRGQARATAKSRQITIPGPTQDQMDNGVYPVETVSVHLKVSKGQELAIDTASNTAEYCSDGTPGQLLFAPTLSVGNGFTSSAGVDDCLLLVQAVVRH